MNIIEYALCWALGLFSIIAILYIISIIWMMRSGAVMYISGGLHWDTYVVYPTTIPMCIKDAGHPSKMDKVHAGIIIWASHDVIKIVKMYMNDGGHSDLGLTEFIKRICPPNVKTKCLSKLLF